jgi:hypothetical protein
MSPGNGAKEWTVTDAISSGVVTVAASASRQQVYLGANAAGLSAAKYPRAYSFNGGFVWEADVALQVLDLDTRDSILYAGFTTLHRRLSVVDGTMVFQIGGGGQQAIGPADRMYIPGSFLTVWSPAGAFISAAPYSGFSNVTDLEVTADGRWILAGFDSGLVDHGRIERLLADGTSQLMIFRAPGLVYAIAADATGNIWAAIETKVVKFDSAGLQLAVYDHGATVHGIACDGDGNVYLCGDEAE